jgi:quercetin dioxygenase-like cupin family protein
MKTRISTLCELLGSLAAVAVFGWVAMGTIKPGVSAQEPSNFMGGAPTTENSDYVRTSRLLFPAGVRSNWHYHSQGQLLMLESGRGLTQVRGGPLLQTSPEQPFYTPANVEHWHGAHPQEAAMQLTISMGTTNWLEPVTDDVYRATPAR